MAVPDLAARCGLEALYLKREDLNPTGSHKARGAAFQVAAEAAAGHAGVVISSSGNAAVAAAAYARPAGLTLAAFVSPDTPDSKLAHLARLGAWIFLTRRAIAAATAVSEALGWTNLRPSVNPLAPEGFMSLGWELAEAARDTEAQADGAGKAFDGVFTFVSSGASFVGVGRAFDRAEAVVGAPVSVPLHPVQGAGAAPIAAEYEPDRADWPQGTVGSLGAKKTRRVGEAKRLIAASGGSAWIADDEEAWSGLEMLADAGIETSLEGGASLSAAVRAAASGRVAQAVVVLTGHASQRPRWDRLEALDRVREIADPDEAVAALRDG